MAAPCWGYLSSYGEATTAKDGTGPWTVTLGAAISANSITFANPGSPTAYTIALGANNLTVGSGGIVNNFTETETFSNGGGSLVLGASQTWNAASGALSVSAGVNLGANTLTVNGANATTLSGVVTGNGGISRSGSGTLTLSGNNTFTGGLSISGGTVTLGNAGALNSTTPNAVSMSGGTLNINGNGVTISDLSGSSGTVNNNGANATLTVNKASGSSAFSGVLANGTGTLGLTKSGAGTLVLSGANTYSGTTTISAGTLEANSAGALGATPTLNITGGTLKLGATPTATPAVSLNGGGTLNANNQSATFSSLTLPASGSGTVDLLAGEVGSTLSLGTVTVNSGGTLTIANWANGTGHDRIWVSSVNNLSAINFSGFSPGAQVVWGKELAPAGVTVVPEPQTYGAIFALGLVGAAFYRRWKAVKA